MQFGNWEMRALLLSSLLILDLGLVILLTRQDDVAYDQESRNLDPYRSPPDSYEHLFCLPLRGELGVLANRTEIELDDLNDDLLNYFQREEFINERKAKLKNYLNGDHYSSIYDQPSSSQIRFSLNHMILEPLKLSDYYIMNGQICFINRESRFRYGAETMSQVFSNESLFAFKKETHDLYKMSSPSDHFHLIMVLNRNQPHCGNSNYTEKHCLNECFRSRFRLSRYFYDGNETGSIQLNWSSQDQSIREHEEFCYENCKQDSCKSTYFIPASSWPSRLTIYTAIPLITSGDFWFRLTGLLLPVVAIVLLQFSAKLIERKAFKVILCSVSLLSVVIVLFALYRQGYPAEDDCEPKTSAKKQISFRLFEPEPFSLIICVPIGYILRGDYHQSYSEKFQKDFKHSYQNRTFAELEMETQKGFEETVESIQLNFFNQNSKVDWKLSPRVLFLGDNRQDLSRCFQVDVAAQEPAYQSMLASTRLTIKFKHREYKLALLPANASPNNDSQFESGLEQKKDQRFEKHSVDCLDYRQMPCGSQKSCVEACMASELFGRFAKIPEKSIIDKAHYDAEQWNNSRIEGTVGQKEISKRIKVMCRNKFKQTDCYSTVFRREEDKKGSRWGGQMISLYYDLVKDFEETERSPFFTELLIVQGVFLALNLLRLATVVGFLKFKVRKMKLLHGLIYGGCLLGLFVHLICALRGAMNEPPALSEHYESPRSMQMNDAVFCLEPKQMDEGNSSQSMVHTNSTANRTDSEPHEKANLRMIIREEEEEENESESENEDTTEAPEAYNATSDSGLRYNETEDWPHNYTELTDNHTTYFIVQNVTEPPNAFNGSFNSSNPAVDEYDELDEEPVGLTGARLEKWTSDLTSETIFDQISYLESSGRWITLDSPNLTNADLHIDSFFYHARKCFSLSTRFDYSRQQFAFLHEQNVDVLKVRLSEWFKQEQNLSLSIATKDRFKLNFHNLFDGLYFKTDMGRNRSFERVYDISQRERVQLSYEDAFYWTNPLKFLFSQSHPDLNRYLTELLDAFRTKYRSATFVLPLQEDDFQLPINDTLFARFYKEYVQENGPPIDREHPELQYSVEELRVNRKPPSPLTERLDYDYDVKFSLSFLRKIVKQSNAGAYLQFVAYLLNALLVLLSIGLFDLLIHWIS